MSQRGGGSRIFESTLLNLELRHQSKRIAEIYRSAFTDSGVRILAPSPRNGVAE